LLASIRGGNFTPCKEDPASIIVTRTQLTREYAHNPKRRSGFTVEQLYERIIPYLIKSGDAQLIEKTGKKETYAFRVE